jgi:hypothetical protein
MYLRAGYLSKLVDQEALDQVARLQLARDQLAWSGSAAVPRP